MGVHPAAIGVDVGGFVDSGEGEAPDVDLHAVPVGGDVAGDGMVGTLGHACTGDGREDAGLGIGAVDEEADRVVVGGAADEGGVEGDIDLLGGVELRGAEAGAMEVAAGDDEVGIVDGDGVDGVGVDEVLVVAQEEAAGGGVLVVGFLPVAEVGGRRETVGELGEGLEDGTMQLLLLGSRIFDEGVVGPEDVAAFPHGADGRTEFSYLDAHVTA